MKPMKRTPAFAGRSGRNFPEQDGYYADSGIVLPYGEVIELYNNKAIVGIHKFSGVSADKPTM